MYRLLMPYAKASVRESMITSHWAPGLLCLFADRLRKTIQLGFSTMSFGGLGLRFMVRVWVVVRVWVRVMVSVGVMVGVGLVRGYGQGKCGVRLTNTTNSG